MKRTLAVISGLLITVVLFCAWAAEKKAAKTGKEPTTEQKLQIKLALAEFQLAQNKADAVARPAAQKLQDTIIEIRKNLKVPETFVWNPQTESFVDPTPRTAHQPEEFSTESKPVNPKPTPDSQTPPAPGQPVPKK